MAHVAVGAALLFLLGVRRREAAVGGLVAAAPDLDAVTGFAWYLLGPHLPLGADGLVLVQHLAGHRGFSHTLPSALVVAGLAWVVAGTARWAGIAGIAWASHAVLDVFTNWALQPLWPVSDAAYRYPLVTTLEPLLSLVGALAVVALLGPAVAGRYELGSPSRRRALRAWGRRWGRPLAYAGLAAVAFNAAWIGAVAAAQDVPFGDTHSAHVPRTATVLDDGDAWEVQTRWAPFHEGATRTVPKMDDRTESGDGGPAMAAAACALDRLGPYRLPHEPFLVARDRGAGVLVEAWDVVGNATEGVPHMEFVVEEETVERAWITGDGQGPDVRFHVPGPVLERARCG